MLATIIIGGIAAIVYIASTNLTAKAIAGGVAFAALLTAIYGTTLL